MVLWLYDLTVVPLISDGRHRSRGRLGEHLTGFATEELPLETD